MGPSGRTRGRPPAHRPGLRGPTGGQDRAPDLPIAPPLSHSPRSVVPPGPPGVVSPLATWLRDAAAVRRFRRRWLGAAPVVLAPCDARWRSLAPAFVEAREMAGSGLPVQIAAERRYDRAPDRRRVARALAKGETVFMPQIHQVLPRVARLMVAIRVAIVGPFRDECSFLFLVEGRRREGMGLHHDGPVDAFWLQLAGHRTVTIGPAVKPGTPDDIEAPGRGPGWRTLDLPPGSLFYLPPWTPHRVVCRARSLALSLTWSPPRRRPRGTGSSGAERLARAATRPEVARSRVAVESLASWDVTDGKVTRRPKRTASWLWTQVPAVAGPSGPKGRFVLWTPDGTFHLADAARPVAGRLADMPLLARSAVDCGPALAPLLAHGILVDEDLPLRILPSDLGTLDGWRFA